MANEYEIITVADFAKVPDDRLKDCLQEFAACVLETRRLNRFALGLDSFTWIDDGIPMIREASIEWPDGTTDAYLNPKFPQA